MNKEMEMIFSSSNDAFSQELEKFAEDISSSSNGKIAMVKETTMHQFLPSLTLSCKGRENIHYSAIPKGPEFEPFMDALKFFSQNDATLPEKTKIKLKKFLYPIEILLLISPECPNCPRLVRLITSMAAINSKLEVYILDATRFSELSEQYCITSVPATIVDKRIVLIGQIEPDKLIGLFLIKNTPEFMPATLMNMVDTKRIQEAIDIVIKHKEYAKALLPTLKSGEFKERLPILFLFEEILEKDADCLDHMVPDLINMVSDADSALIGDTADLLGKIGSRQAIPYLEKLTENIDPDIVEAATSALEEIKTREK
jgi:hypothetical protein